MDQAKATNTPPDALNALDRRPEPGTDLLAGPGARAPVTAASCECGSPGGICTCRENPSNGPLVHVYALGRVEPRFPRLGVEKEFAQATGRAGTAGLTDPQALHTVLSDRQNRYLVRKLCWVF